MAVGVELGQSVAVRQRHVAHLNVVIVPTEHLVGLQSREKLRFGHVEDYTCH